MQKEAEQEKRMSKKQKIMSKKLINKKRNTKASILHILLSPRNMQALIPTPGILTTVVYVRRAVEIAADAMPDEAGNHRHPFLVGYLLHAVTCTGRGMGLSKLSKIRLKLQMVNLR